MKLTCSGNQMYIMGLKKKKNIIVLTLCVVNCFILYQLYFFLTLSSSEASNRKVVPVFEHDVKEVVHLRSEADKFINSNGVIRGVYYSHMPKYRPDSNHEFKCLKSEQKIPYDNVNDDYCDCDDGTDEPSTNACVNGTFYCETQYHNKPIKVHTVPSSKVNDGICDCCDGSDEWIHDPDQKLLSQSDAKHYRYYVSKCPNFCK